MAKVSLQLGAELDLLNKDELRDELSRSQEWQRAAAFGVRHQALPRMVGTPAGGVLNLGYDQPDQVYCGPKEGWYWAISRISVDGLSTNNQTGTFQSGTFTAAGGSAGLPLFFGPQYLTGFDVSAAGNGTAAGVATVTVSNVVNGPFIYYLNEVVGTPTLLSVRYPGNGITASGGDPTVTISAVTNGSSGNISVFGLNQSAASSTQDVVKVYIQNRFVGYIGASPGYGTFGIREAVMKPGDFLRVIGTGLQTGNQVEVYGDAISAPGPMMWKLFS